jgi:hypothetical protein
MGGGKKEDSGVKEVTKEKGDDENKLVSQAD